MGEIEVKNSKPLSAHEQYEANKQNEDLSYDYDDPSHMGKYLELKFL